MAEFDLPEGVQVTLNEGAAVELTEIAQLYWEASGVDPVSRRPVWVRAARDIDSDSWASSAHVAAAAGCTATAGDYACSACGQPLTLTSRQTLADAASGLKPRCRTCSPAFERQVGKLLGPEAASNADGRRRHAESQAVAAAERRANAEAQRSRQEDMSKRRATAIADRYPIDEFDAADLVAAADFEARAGALAVITAGGTSDGLVRGIPVHDGSIAPTRDLASRLALGSARSARLLQVHPGSPEDGFVFEGIHLTDRWYPANVHFYAGGAGGLPERWTTLVDEVRASLDLGSLDREVDDLVEMARQVVAGEVVRYLTFRFEDHNLPDPLEEHADHVRIIADRGAARYSIGHLYTAAWMAARDAAASYQKHSHQSKADAVTYGVRQFERLLQKFIDGEFKLREPYAEDKKNLPLSALTNVVFSQILGLNPMVSSIAHVEQAVAFLRDRQDRCIHALPERHDMIEAIRTRIDEIDPVIFRRALALGEDEPPARCGESCILIGIAPASRDLGRFYDRVVARIGGRDAVIVTSEASELSNSVWGTAGDAALAALLTLVLPVQFSDL
ncbi:hypothetical protein [Frigoribacterium sp. CFBP 8751]|uniref:hypothetical protein n=1 Tax=Frigoribacterium sp. CFBP 8751 TaxID=2775277 RepID=UPI00177F3329|nr:hypothetical protein [Frigoribacterium sp. CFBP 8751]MBD8539240.1 hypothetical protein [Frigoribacterium sp. CFBP 8751]